MQSICTDVRESASKPDMGIISMFTRGLNQDGVEIVTWFRSVMIPKRASGIGQNYFPTPKSGPIEERMS
jgi:acyl dehydratase